MFYEPVFEYEGFALVARPDTPNYYAYWRPRGRPVRRKSLATNDRSEAQRRLIAFADDRRTARKAKPEDVPIRRVLDGYVEQHLTGKSQRDARSVLRHWTRFLDDEDLRTVAEMTPGVQRAYVAWRRKQGQGRLGKALSNATINKELEVLRAAMNAWRREGFVSETPHVRMLPKPSARDRFLTPDEVRRLLAECHKPHLRRFILISLHTLQRPGAVLGLRAEQVDLSRRRIDFAPPGWIQTAKRRPVVPITTTLLSVLEEAMAESISGYVIEHIGRPVQSVKGSFGKACERAGLNRVTPYVLRHTGATLLAGAGVPLWQVSGMLGHSLSRTTEIYAKHTPEYLKGAADGLESVLGAETLGISPPICDDSSRRSGTK